MSRSRRRARTARRGRRVSERRLHHADSTAFRQGDAGAVLGRCDRRLRRRGPAHRLHGHLVRFPVADAADAVHLPRALVLDAGQPRRDRRVLGEPARGAPRGAGPPLQRTRRRARPRRFEGAQWIALATGAPILADALAAFDCLVEEAIERHSHAIILGAVVSLREGADEPALALYGAGTYAPRGRQG